MDEFEQIGTALRDAREALGLSISETAARLLVSPLQLRSMENGTSGGFYGEKFRERALQKYCQLVGVRPEQTSGVAEDGAEPGESFVFEVVEKDSPAASVGAPASATPESRRTLVWLAVCVVAVVVIAAVVLYPGARPKGEAAAPEGVVVPATQSGAAAAEATAVADTPTASMADPTPATIIVRASGPCWVLTRDVNGKETEKTLRAGEQIELPADLQYLAIGDTGVASMEIGNRPVDLAPWTNPSRTARLSNQALESLRKGG